MTGIATKPKSSPSGSLRLVGVIGGILFGFSLLFFVGWMLVGTEIRGTEFSPQTFQTRTFSYRRFPWTKIRVSPTVLGLPSSPVGRPVLQHLTSSTQNPRWDVVRVTNGAITEQRPPQILIELIGTSGPNLAGYWNDWSADNADKAKVLWPLVQRAAEEELYHLTPRLLEAAQDASSPSELQTTCQELLDREMAVARSSPPAP